MQQTVATLGGHCPCMTYVPGGGCLRVGPGERCRSPLTGNGSRSCNECQEIIRQNYIHRWSVFKETEKTRRRSNTEGYRRVCP